MENLQWGSEYTLNNFKSAIDAGMIVHYVVLRKWGLHAKNILGFEDSWFKASDWWVWKFKQTHRITSRKVNKFITIKTLETHSHTIQPTISADGKLLSPLYIVLKEPSGKFGLIVQETIFQPINVFVAESTSGKLTSGKFVYF